MRVRAATPEISLMSDLADNLVFARISYTSWEKMCNKKLKTRQMVRHLLIRVATVWGVKKCSSPYSAVVYRTNPFLCNIIIHVTQKLSQENM